MIGYKDQETIDPRELDAGDQVGCHDAVGRLQLLTGAGADGEHGIDVVWVTLHNQPGKTTHIWDTEVPQGNVALRLGDHDWRVLVLPLVLARRRIG